MELLNLHEISKIEKIKQKIKEDEKCLTFKILFKSQGRQGIVGIFDIYNKYECVFKIPLSGENVLIHEKNVYKDLFLLSSFCIHYPIYIDWVEKTVDLDYYEKQDPFARTKGRVKKGQPIQVLISEYIKSVKLSNIVYDERINLNTIFSLMKQVIFALYIGQTTNHFTHYDLHSNNVVVKNCDPNIIFVYVVRNSDGGESYECVPSYGMCSVLIDFGYSYTKGIENSPLYSTMEYTEYGYTSNYHDELVDIKRFLVSLTIDIKESKKNKKIGKEFRNKVKKIFRGKGLDFNTGWENYGNSRKSICKLLKFDKKNINHNKKSIIFKYKYRFVEALQSLIDLPFCIHEKCYDKSSIMINSKLAFNGFLKEWNKIEKEIRNKNDCISILEGIIKSAKTVKKLYESNDRDNIQESINSFRKGVYYTICKTVDLCSPKNIEFELFLCSILLLSRSILFILDKENNKIQEIRNRYNYKNTKLLDVYNKIQKILKTPFNTFSKDSTFIIMNPFEKTCCHYKLTKDDDIHTLNMSNNVSSTLYNIIKFQTQSDRGAASAFGSDSRGSAVGDRGAAVCDPLHGRADTRTEADGGYSRGSASEGGYASEIEAAASFDFREDGVVDVEVSSSEGGDESEGGYESEGGDESEGGAT